MLRHVLGGMRELFGTAREALDMVQAHPIISADLQVIGRRPSVTEIGDSMRHVVYNCCTPRSILGRARCLVFQILGAGVVIVELLAACTGSTSRSAGSSSTASVLRLPACPSDVGGVPWCRNPPGGLNPANIPQFVAVTFDDNFGDELGPSSVA